MKRNQFSLVLTTQLVYLFLCSAWNIFSVWRVYMGEQAIGPTPSLIVIALLLSLMVILSISYAQKWQRLYVILSIFICYISISAITGAFLKDPSLWPSDALRFSGVAINVVGICSFVILMTRWKYLIETFKLTQG
jgi:hypothetical protein